MPDQIGVVVRDCARCGGDHLCVVFTPFTKPPLPYSHFGICPTNQEPILMVTITQRIPVRTIPSVDGGGA